MTLTTDQMEQAYFARRVDTDPDLADLPEKKRPVIIAGECMWDLDDTIARYQAGKAVLEQYTLSVSFRYWKGCEPGPDHWPDAAGTIVVPAGHIAGTEAVRVAIFRPRA